MCFQDENAFDRIFTEATFKSYVFKMRAKVEPYNVSNSSEWCTFGEHCNW